MDNYINEIEMESNSRKPTIKEMQLIEFLIKSASNKIPINWKDGLLVSNMNDGGMGSLKLFNLKINKGSERVFGKQISEMQFTDLDGIKVNISLNIDNEGNLFELDVWKTNFEKLIEFPNLDNLI